LNQFLASRGITMPTTAPDAATIEARKFAESQGKPVVGGTPTTVQPTVGAPTSAFAPSGTVAPTPPAPSAIPPELEYVRPPGTVGMISGRPAGEVIAEGALRTGVTPQSESGRTALAARLSKEGLPFFTKTTEPTGAVAAEKPVTPPAPPTASVGQPWNVTPEEAAKNRAAVGGFFGSFLNLPGAKTAETESKRTMAGFLPPPSPLGPETGGMNFADITKPSANLAAGPIPAAVPTPQPIPDEVLRRRLATQTQQQ